MALFPHEGHGHQDPMAHHENRPTDNAGDSAVEEPPRKRRRARTGCLTCRARRVKCDEAHPQCRNCASRQVECTWGEAGGAAEAGESASLEASAAPRASRMGPQTARAAAATRASPTTTPPPPTPLPSAIAHTSTGTRSLACFRCRTARAKCSQARPTCARCAAHGHRCQYPENKGSLTPAAQSWIRHLQGRDAAGEDGSVDSQQPGPQTQADLDHRSAVEEQGPRHGHDSPGQGARGAGPHGQDESNERGESDERDESDDTADHNPPSPYEDHSTYLPGSYSGVVAAATAPMAYPPGAVPQRHALPVPAPAQTQIQTAARLPCQDRIERLAVAFFLHVHVYRANGFFQRDTTLAAVRERRLAEPLLLGLCAVGSRFASPAPESASESASESVSDASARAWAAEAGRLVTASTEVSRENVEAALLLTIYAQQAGRFAQAHLWAGVAMQQAVSLGLHREPAVGTAGATATFADGERDRRLFFACYAMNRFLASGAPESMHCPASRIRLRLPCDGFSYRMGLAVETPYAVLETDDDADTHRVPGWLFKNVGVMGFWARLVGVRAMIKQYFYGMMEARRIASDQAQEEAWRVPGGADAQPPGSGAGGGGSLVGMGSMPAMALLPPPHHAAPPPPPPSSFSPHPVHSSSSSSHASPPSSVAYAAPWLPGSPFGACLAKLAALRESLPLRLQLGRALRTRPHDWPALGQIVLFYLWWNECHIELGSVVLPGYPQSLDAAALASAPAGWVSQTRQSCLRHALAITDTLALVERELPPSSSRRGLTVHDHTIAHAVYLSLRVQLELRAAAAAGHHDQRDYGMDEDEASRAALQARLEMMLGCVERTSTYFHSVHLVLKEMRRMLARHGLSSQSYPESESRAETPPLPWFQRQKTLDSQSLAESADMLTAKDAANLEAILLELLPDCSAHTSWVRAHDANAPYLPVSQVPLQSSSAWDHVPNLWMGPTATNNTAVNGDPGLATPQVSTMGILDGWDRVAELSRLDSLLPS